MKARVVTAVAALTLASPSHADRIDDIAADQMKASHLPGVAIAIVDKGRITKLAGNGNASLEWPAKVDPDRRFQLASATKLFTAILLMRPSRTG